MDKKPTESEHTPECEPVSGASIPPVRSNSNNRSGASHSSAKRKRAKPASRKGNVGGMHLRGDKRVVR